MRALLRRFRQAPAPRSDSPVRSISRTHVGSVRAVNEDRVLDNADSRLWVVADGMGGQARGDVAAQTVIGCLSALTGSIGPEQLDAALERANREIYEMSGGASGTTLVLLHIDGGIATIRWAGDSRAYLVRNERLKLLTRDHSVVQELLEAGLVDADQAAHHPQANVITRALGIAPKPNLETITVALERADCVLLCSDGLSRTLDERDVQGWPTIADLADRLLTNSLQRDGSDNTSLVLIEVI